MPSSSRTVLIWIGTIAVAAFVFQVFFRYSYTTSYGVVRERIDRLTGLVCRMPCTPAPRTVPTVPPTPLSHDLREAKYQLEDQEAIRLAKSDSVTSSLTANYPHDRWAVEGRFAVDGSRQATALEELMFTPNPSSTNQYLTRPIPFPVRLVAFTNQKGFGFRWEVHLDTHEVFFANDNAELMKKYGLLSK